MVTPLPKEKEYAYQANGVQYIILITPSINNILFVINKEGNLPRKRFEAKFNYEDLTKKGKWFCLFESIAAIAIEIGYLLDEKKYQIKEKTDQIDLHLLIKLRYVEELILEIPLCELKSNDIIQDLCYSFNEMKTTLGSINEKFSILEQSPMYKKIFEKGKAIKDNLVFSDANFLETIQQKISSTERVSFSLLHSTTTSGDNCSAFHTNCDQKGPTLVIIQSTKNYVFGGYSDINWDQSNTTKNSGKCFLFSLNLKKIYPSKNTGYSIYCSSSYGPTFGGGNGNDIYIGANCFSHNSNNVAFVNYSNGSGSELAGESSFTVKEMEVYEVKIGDKA